MTGVKSIATMLLSARRIVYQSAIASTAPTSLLPLFLLPAFQPLTPSKRTFSSTPSHASQVGRAPISVPPEVTLRVLEPTVIFKSRRRGDGDENGPIIEVEGPRGLKDRLH